MVLVELELDGVLDRHDALTIRDEPRQHVEERRLPGAGTAADHDVQLALDSGGAEVGHPRCDGAHIDEVVDLEGIVCELPDRERRSIDGKRGDDGIDTRTILEPCIHHRGRLVDATPDARHDAIDDAPQVLT